MCCWLLLFGSRLKQVRGHTIGIHVGDPCQLIGEHVTIDAGTELVKQRACQFKQLGATINAVYIGL